ncbi:hypothetical protein CEUSTIGMA_g11413.t1 [Chlamydomonas eustigma]|uniref:Peptidase S26 domain-containing protein n=1 Tax=Chlamydomonas eustigma TaxID=1157962 RepID=A0A250XLN8_9CHLO|nr:hypothetical protein CEUSTIGMA_g11413.t1 [Chlamydomonas eustigma]|eukprot:GAX83988.1 hypothetical protein CEUSTIGMA_g11413.t1 [Chlamydomonas eustigma]
MISKFYTATEEFFHQLLQPVAKTTSDGSSVFAAAMKRFQEAYAMKLTTTMYMAGAAMCPSLNRRALKDTSAVEKLVIRLLPRPSTRSVWVGDVIAFNSPLGKISDPAQVMVRRVAAIEGTDMVSSAEEEDFQIPAGHCWVLADNPEMKPPQVIDSRTFGFIPLSNIVGRVIYSGTSAVDHAPVTNSPLAQAMDDPILEAEVCLEELFRDPAAPQSDAGNGEQHSEK